MTHALATIRNQKGIHVRPSGLIMGAIMGYAGVVTLKTADTEIAVDSAISIIMLGLAPGDTVEITVEGPEEERMCGVLHDLFERHFDFPDA